MSETKIPDPRPGVGTDLELWYGMAEQLCGHGFVLEQIRAAQVKCERGDYANAALEALKSYWGILGAKSMVENGLELVKDMAERDKMLAAWKLFEQRAKICLHNLDKLPELVQVWKGTAG